MIGTLTDHVLLFRAQVALPVKHSRLYGDQRPVVCRHFHAPVAVLGVALNPKYAEQLLQMPDLEVKAEPNKLIFRSGKRWGAIMGMKV